MSAITKAKEAVAEILAALPIDDEHTLTATTYLPGSIDPPTAVVLPGSPYIERETFQQFLLRLDVLVVVEVGDNDVVVEQLDGLLDDVVVALATAGYGIGTIGDPLPFRIQQALYLSVTVPISTSITL